ncbi:twin-arginine translocation signal domain-containing protein [Haloarchaeobius sp. DFWS5]|uniref:twin-arginine translocation signal domain-containing protein n=1 Tax=Haloarchaeobius sp. DFWS5 TaxID=3446114 RepID=UPI003EB822F5
MPSRRTFLGAAGTGVPLLLAGCLNSPKHVEGYIQFKSIHGVNEEPGRHEGVSIIDVDASYAPNEEPPGLVHLDEEWADRFPDPRAPVVSDALHDAFTERFDSIRYIVGTTSPGWAEDGESVGSFNVATTRENFNRVQVHSKVTASSDGTYLTIHSVDGLWEFDADGQ